MKMFMIASVMRTSLVQRGALEAELVDLSVKSCDVFRQHFKEFELTENMRSREDASYTSFIRSVGNGDGFEGNAGEVALPEDIVVHVDLVEETYGEMLQRAQTRDALMSYLSQRCILAPLNRTCEQYNRQIVERMSGDSMEYTSVDEMKEDSKSDDSTNYPPEFLNSLNPPELPPHRLLLKENAVVLLMRNLWVEKGMCNGTR